MLLNNLFKISSQTNRFKLKKVTVAGALAVGAMATMNANAATYFQDSGSYTFNGFNSSYTIGGVIVNSPYIRQVPFLSTAPTGSALTLSFTISGLTSSIIGTYSDDLIFAVLDTNNNYVGVNVDILAFADGAVSSTLVLNGDGTSFEFGTPSWSFTNSVTISNILVCDASGCSVVPSTLVDLAPNAHALRGAFSMQSALINTGLTYDCTTFDENGICLSAGGRITDTNNPSTNSQGALLIASYRASDHWRVGAYLV